MKNFNKISAEYKNEFFKNGNIYYFLIALEMKEIANLRQQIKENNQEDELSL